MIISSWGHLILSYYMSFFWWKEIREVILNSTVSLLVSSIYILISSVHKATHYSLHSWFHCAFFALISCFDSYFGNISLLSETYAQPSFISLQCKCHILHQNKSSSYNILQFCSIASRPYVFTIMLVCLFSFFWGACVFPLLSSQDGHWQIVVRWLLPKCWSYEWFKLMLVYRPEPVVVFLCISN
jgi:hypothetical protein